jgi:hypothetical protein
MKAISAPRTEVDAAHRAERGLGPFATLGPPDLPSRPYLPKGAKGAGFGGQLAPTSSRRPNSVRGAPACIAPCASARPRRYSASAFASARISPA